MQNCESEKKKDITSSDVKLEKFKKAAFEVIEYKDKIIRMLCAILEVQGTTTLNIKEFISSAANTIKYQLFENNEYELKENKKRTSSRKRTLINISEYKKIKKNKELNLFSTPNKINEELNNEKNYSDSVLSSYKMSLKGRHSIDKMMNNSLMHNCSERKALQDLNASSIQENNTDKKNALLKTNDGLVQNFIESVKINRKKALENFENPDINYECTYKSDSDQGIKSSKAWAKIDEVPVEECQLCLMPITESLHGNFPPVSFKLNCDHVFHLMCLYETIIRRECRKTCCICHDELSEDDKNDIITKIKIEKKEHDKKSKLLLKAMKLQADKN